MTRPLSWSFTFTRRMAREVLLQNMFHDAVAKLDIPLPPLYPTGASANYGLFYLILRIVSENSIRRVLDVGAGQSTLLLNALAKKYGLDVVTLETDADWANRIGQQVDHPVHHSPLAQRSIHGVDVQGYADLSAIDGKFDLILIDAPIGTKRHSRWAGLEVIDRFREQECVVIFDDAERRGERDTINRFSALHEDLKGRYFRPAAAQQFVACSSRFSHIVYYRWS
ncbi:MAG TPA: hypothetical protein VJM09_13230 [Sphingobium sp.]|nr:hypothetical protein [Sphingobium sp.]